MRSPVLAMLWEQWRLTRLEAAWRLSTGLVAGAAALALIDGATVAFMLLLGNYFLFWMSIARLNGGRFMDGYTPGFPLYLLYTRPVRTGMFVGVAAAYDAVSNVALYLISAGLLGVVSGRPLPLLSVAVWIVTFHLFSICIQWTTRNRVVQWLGSFSLYALLGLPLFYRTDWSVPRVAFSPGENALMLAMGLVAVGLTIAGVSRQRRGDPVVAMPWSAGLGTWLPAWRMSTFGAACPTTSATRAQVWFELRSSGGQVLAIAAALALALPLLFAVAGPVAPVRQFALGVTIFLPAVLLLGGNAFGIRRKQGRLYASAFEATQPCGTARLAGIKVLVRAVCLLAAVIVVGTSLWASLSLVRGWMGEGRALAMEAAFWDLPFSRQQELVGSEAAVGWGWRRAIQGAFQWLTGAQLVAPAVVLPIGLAAFVALRAALAALWARHRRRMTIAGALLLLHLFGLVLVETAGRGGYVPAWVANAGFGATIWLVVAAMAAAAAWLLRCLLAERLLAPHLAFAFVAAAVGAVAWVTVRRATDVPLSLVTATQTVLLLLPVLLALVAGVLAPWSLSRVRHT